MSSPSSAVSPTRPIPRSGGLSDAERRAWRRDGFFVRRGVLRATEVGALREAARTLESTLLAWGNRGRAYHHEDRAFRDVGRTTLQYDTAPGHSLRLRVAEPAHPHHPTLGTLVDHPGLVDPLRDLFGGETLSLFTDKLNWKHASFGSGFGWHRDAPYWVHLPGVAARIESMANVLVYFDDADTQNGCFRVVRASHRLGPLPPDPAAGSLAPLFVDPTSLREDSLCDLAVEAGSAVFFHPELVHGSAANPSPRPRRAMVLTAQVGVHPMFKASGVRVLGRP